MRHSTFVPSTLIPNCMRIDKGENDPQTARRFQTSEKLKILNIHESVLAPLIPNVMTYGRVAVNLPTTRSLEWTKIFRFIINRYEVETRVEL